jgi:predicted nuclease with TOPRIM domain
MQAVRKKLAEVTVENDALRSELAAFDPEFWDEIEDLKYEKHELGDRVKRYTATIRSLSAQLNVIPELD